jgi:hypothetical protein
MHLTTGVLTPGKFCDRSHKAGNGERVSLSGRLIKNDICFTHPPLTGVSYCRCRRAIGMPSSSRLTYIDWMRGLVCVLMFQTHCYDSWLNPEARKSSLFIWSQLG